VKRLPEKKQKLPKRPEEAVGKNFSPITVMIHEDTDVIFPPRVIPVLGDLREKDWRKLVNRVTALPLTHPERLGFVLMMTKICGCSTCQADSFRAMRGCTYCATQAVKRHRGEDADLIESFNEARVEVQMFLEKKR